MCEERAILQFRVRQLLRRKLTAGLTLTNHALEAWGVKEGVNLLPQAPYVLNCSILKLLLQG